MLPTPFPRILDSRGIMNFAQLCHEGGRQASTFESPRHNGVKDAVGSSFRPRLVGQGNERAGGFTN